METVAVPTDCALEVRVNAETLLVMDLSINPALDGRQTHMEFKDLFDALPFQGREPTKATMSRAAAKSAKRRIG